MNISQIAREIITATTLHTQASLTASLAQGSTKEQHAELHKKGLDQMKFAEDKLIAILTQFKNEILAECQQATS